MIFPKSQVEEITFDSPSSSSSGPRPFRPTVTKVVMTHADLLAALKNMVRRQQDDITEEQKFLDSLLMDE